MSYGDYGDPWSLGFLDAIFEPEDLKNAGLLLAGGAAAFVVAPQVLNLIKSKKSDSFLNKYGVWLRAGASLAGGYALYKYGKGGGSTTKDLSFAAGAVLLGLGGATVVKAVLPEMGLKDGIIALNGPMPEEAALLAALEAIEDGDIAGLGFQLPEASYQGMDADAYEPMGVAGMDADVANALPGQGPWDADVEQINGIDADVNEFTEYAPYLPSDMVF